MKFARDRRRWVRWLYEARKRFGLTVLNYMVTSNHIHLLVVDGEDESTIARSMQLVAGRTAQEYNLRKKRKGAFWEDRYHTTAIETGEHLRRCMAYIDLNMCRAGKVDHPAQWECCGYLAIQNPPLRYQIIDRERGAGLLGFENVDELVVAQREWVACWQEILSGRDLTWSESLAIGSRAFVSNIQVQLNNRARHRQVEGNDGRFVLKESSSAYGIDSDHEIDALSSKFMYPWKTTS